MIRENCKMKLVSIEPNSYEHLYVSLVRLLIKIHLSHGHKRARIYIFLCSVFRLDLSWGPVTLHVAIYTRLVKWFFYRD